MTGFLTTSYFMEHFGGEVRAAAVRAGLHLEPVLLPLDESARIDPAEAARVEVAYFSTDVFAQKLARGFFAAAQGAENLKWLHVFNAGVDNPVFIRTMERGVRITTSSGSTALPIAQSLIGGLLMLARGFPAWGDAQRRRSWEPHPAEQTPHDLGTQTLVVYGMGAIGTEVARLGKALGLHTIGIRRSPLKPGDPVDEMLSPAALDGILPRCDWLALACPLTPETRQLLNARRLALMPKGSHLLNISRGEVADEAALIAALASGQLGGAYLDVFEVEPLPADSQLWAMPNVIVSPHNSAAARGNEARAAAIFLANLEAYGRGLPLVNEAAPPR